MRTHVCAGDYSWENADSKTAVIEIERAQFRGNSEQARKKIIDEETGEVWETVPQVNQAPLSFLLNTFLFEKENGSTRKGNLIFFVNNLVIVFECSNQFRVGCFQRIALTTHGSAQW